MRCVCPFCGGTLPGRPGQYVKCMHCAEAICLAYGKPFRTQGDALEHARACRVAEQDRAQREAEERHLEQIRESQRLDEIASQRRQRILERSRRRVERRHHWARQWAKWDAWLRSHVDRARSLIRLLRPFFWPAWFYCLTILFLVLFATRSQPLSPLTSSQPQPLPPTTGLLERNDLKTLTVSQANELSRHNGPLHLNGLLTLSPEAAYRLASHQGFLYLGGVRWLDAEAARALASHKGWVELNGLKYLSPEASSALRRNPSIHLPAQFCR